MDGFENEINSIIQDNQSGSASILTNTIAAVQELVLSNTDPDRAKLLSTLNKLKDAHPNFAILHHFINKLLIEIQAGMDRDIIIEYINSYQEKWEDSTSGIAMNVLKAIDFNGKSVLVHSNSSAIHNLFMHLSKKNIATEVYQTVSSPANEGRIQAELIANFGFQVNFIHENAVGKFIQEIDMAIFGADIVTENQFMNKTGTLPISLLFNHSGKPVYVLADSRKFINTKELPDEVFKRMSNEHKKNPDELWVKPPVNVIP